LRRLARVAAPTIDRCATHGFWFGKAELDAVLERSRSNAWRSAPTRSLAHASLQPAMTPWRHLSLANPSSGRGWIYGEGQVAMTTTAK